MNSVVVGLTGQTGAGKSTVSEFMKKLSCKIISADAVAREATSAGSECLKRLAEHFGYDIIDKDGNCNRKLLAKKAFSSRENTDILDSITHPWILNRTEEYISHCKADNCGIIVFDAPQLFESGGERLCNCIVAVTAPMKIRLERIIRRDGITEQEAMMRINAQFDEAYYTSRADYIIDGSAEIKQVEHKVWQIISEIRKLTEVYNEKKY